jgi:hypothetical protein
MLNSLFLRLGKLITGFAFMISPMALALSTGLLDNNHPAVQAGIAVQKTVTDNWTQQPTMRRLKELVEVANQFLEAS